MLRVYLTEHVPRSAAAISYYLTISIFPLLICVSAILGSLNIDEDNVIEVLTGIIPQGAVNVITDFLRYVSGNRSSVMIAFGLFVMVSSSSAALRTIINTMVQIQGKARYNNLIGTVFSFLLSIAFLAAIYISGLVVVSGEWLIGIIERQFGYMSVLEFWRWMRFVIMFTLLFTVIYVIYYVSSPKETKRTHRLPGALLAAILLVIVSIVFSKMISESVKYAVVYGSLASFIIMMVWIYFCGVILIMGNVLNISLRSMPVRKE